MAKFKDGDHLCGEGAYTHMSGGQGNGDLKSIVEGRGGFR